MRLFAMAALTTIGFGIVASSSAYAVPINTTATGKADGAITTVHYRGWGWGGFAAGAVAGAIVGGMLTAPYYAPGPGYYYGGGSPDAVRYCMQRYRSYDPGSGTYLGYDGYRHPCP